MKRTLLVPAVVLLLAACATSSSPLGSQAFVETKETSTTNVGSCSNPVPIAAYSPAAAATARDMYIAARYPGHTKASISSARCKGRTAEVARFRDAEGKKVKLYFDTSTWARQN